MNIDKTCLVPGDKDYKIITNMQSAGSGFRKHKHNCHSILKQTIHILGNDDDGKTMTMRRPARSPWSIYKPGVRGRRNLSIMDGPCLSADFAVADTGRLGWARPPVSNRPATAIDIRLHGG